MEKKAKIWLDTRGSAAGEYMAALALIGLVGTAGFTAVGSSMDNDIAGPGTPVAQASTMGVAASAPGATPVAVGGAAARADVDVSVSCSESPDVCESLIKEQLGIDLDCGTQAAACEAALKDITTGAPGNDEQLTFNDVRGGLGDLASDGLGWIGDRLSDGVNAFTSTVSAVWNFQTELADRILPGHGLNPFNVLDGILPGDGFLGEDGFLSRNLFDWVLPGDGFFGDDGIFTRVGGIADAVLPGHGLNPFNIADAVLPGHGLNPFNIADAVLPGHGFFGDDGMFTRIGARADAVLPGHGLNPFNIADAVLPGHGFLGPDGWYAWQRNTAVSLAKIPLGMLGWTALKTVEGADWALDTALPGSGYFGPDGFFAHDAYDWILPGHGYYGPNGFLPNWFPGQSADNANGAVNNVPVGEITANSQRVIDETNTLTNGAREADQVIPAYVADPAQARIDEAQAQIDAAQKALGTAKGDAAQDARDELRRQERHLKRVEENLEYRRTAHMTAGVATAEPAGN